VAADGLDKWLISDGSGAGEERETTEGVFVGVDDKLEGGEEREPDGSGLGGRPAELDTCEAFGRCAVDIKSKRARKWSLQGNYTRSKRNHEGKEVR
jgi:hypothetical protein